MHRIFDNKIFSIYLLITTISQSIRILSDIYVIFLRQYKLRKANNNVIYLALVILITIDISSDGQYTQYRIALREHMHVNVDMEKPDSKV